MIRIIFPQLCALIGVTILFIAIPMFFNDKEAKKQYFHIFKWIYGLYVVITLVFFIRVALTNEIPKGELDRSNVEQRSNYFEQSVNKTSASDTTHH